MKFALMSHRSCAVPNKTHESIPGVLFPGTGKQMMQISIEIQRTFIYVYIECQDSENSSTAFAIAHVIQKPVLGGGGGDANDLRGKLQQLLETGKSKRERTKSSDVGVDL
jgi:hypothetical protein